jgi:FtsP/CotA-like multicopper oxidase with cupredoxin domain
MKSTCQPLNRRRFIRVSAALGLLAGLQRIMPAYAGENTGLKASPVGDSEASEIDLLIREQQLQFGKRRGTAITINGTVPCRRHCGGVWGAPLVLKLGTITGSTWGRS